MFTLAAYGRAATIRFRTQRSVRAATGIAMPYYCVNKNAQSSSGDHEVHDVNTTQGCLPITTNRIDLGYHTSCSGAITEARRYYADVNGCYLCANNCHTT